MILFKHVSSDFKTEANGRKYIPSQNSSPVREALWCTCHLAIWTSANMFTQTKCLESIHKQVWVETLGGHVCADIKDMILGVLYDLA
jgi:hypothetical protein